MHLLPKRVADLSGSKWGLTVTPSSYLTSDARSTTLQSTEEFLNFVQKQNPSVKDHGVWIVTTDPEAYTDEEKSFLNDVIAVCKKNKILLFVTRASELPNGWKRYDESH